MRYSIFIFLVFIPILHAQTPTKILILGDSLTEGYGISKEAAFPAQVEKILLEKKKKITVINAGSSGSTSASGASRLQWLLNSHPQILVLALGANDGLRGIDLVQTGKNLDATIELAKKNKLKILLAGMKLPTNYGEDYRKKFEVLFSDLQKKHGISLIPFLLEGVGGNPKLNLPDGIHPNEEGHKIIAKHLAPYLEKLL